MCMRFTSIHNNNNILFLTVKSEEVMLLWKRFHQLGPDKNGHVHRSVFANNSIYTSTFCKQVVIVSWCVLYGV